MDSRQISRVLRKDDVASKHFVGVFPSDKLPKKMHGALVANTDPHNKPGMHWVAFFVDHDDCMEYFDSYGMVPFVKSFQKILKRSPNGWMYNTKRIQGPLSTTCGHYCVYFLLLRCRGYSLQDIVSVFDRHNLVENDITIADFINEHFDLHTESHDIDFIVNQVSKAFGC